MHPSVIKLSSNAVISIRAVIAKSTYLKIPPFSKATINFTVKSIK